MDGEVKQSASRMMNSAVFGQIIILIVYLPIFTLEGIEGKMFKPMAQNSCLRLVRCIHPLTHLYSNDECVISEQKNLS